MAVNLHNLRGKIAAAALVKGAAWNLSRLPGGRRAITATANRLHPQDAGEVTGSYRGLLAQLLRDVLPDDGAEVTYDPIAGLVPGTVTPAADLSALEDSALENSARTHPGAGSLIALAAAYRKPYVGRYEDALHTYERAFAHNPADLRSVEGIINCGARTTFDWPRIWTAVETLLPARGAFATETARQILAGLFSAHPDQRQLAQAIELITEQDSQQQDSQLQDQHQLLLEALSVRLQFLGQFAVGARVREHMARNRISELRGIPLESPLWLKHLLGAHVLLGQYQQAQRRAAAPRLTSRDPKTRVQLAKLRADVALVTGDPEPLQEHILQRAQQMPLPGEQRMRELVAGRRVAVVGPADTGDKLGDLIDSYDLVVRTRYQPEFVAQHRAVMGTRTDIAYYSGRDLHAMLHEVNSAAEAGALQMVVARPFSAPLIAERPSWLRFARTEFGLYFRGAPLATQRILYDLLQFAPAEIALFNVDFFTGSTPYAADYRDRSSSFGPYSPMNDVVMVHDLLTEFRHTKAFQRTGLITAHGAAGQVLALTDEQYLQLLEAQSPLPQR